jgi:hypothetical protein
LRHYDLKGQKIQTGKANENGDIEQRHHRLKRAVEQALFLRSISDFSTRKEYEAFLRKLFSQLNAGRQEQFKEELKVLKSRRCVWMTIQSLKLKWAPAAAQSAL